MSVRFDIDRAGLSARLVGQEDDAGPLDRALRRMLTQEVLPTAAAALEGRFGPDAILCLPDLPVAVTLTLEEALSGQGARRWADRLIAELDQRLEDGRGAWAFPDAPGFLAAYLRARLGIGRVPVTAFSGMGALDLLSPIQAVCEALRSAPVLWRRLTNGGSEDCRRLVRALAAQGGEAALASVLRAGLDPKDATAPRVTGAALIPVLAGLVTGDGVTWHWAVHPRTGQGAAETALLLAVALAPEIEHHAAAAGLVLALILSERMEGPATGKADRMIARLRGRTDALPPRLRAQAVGLIDILAQHPDGPEALLQLAGRVARLRAETMERTKGSPIAAKAEGAAPPDASPDHDPGARVLHSPIAGVALCLPFLAENRIGRDFPAHVRLQALAQLAADGPVEDPEADPVLMALCGHDDEAVLPARPAELDMLFVPLDRHAQIQGAAPGAARLAAWAEARLAASLPGLGASSRTFLRSQFFHWPGTLILGEDRAVIEIDAMPLRPVLEMGALLGEDRGRMDWLGCQQMSLRLREVAP